LHNAVLTISVAKAVYTGTFWYTGHAIVYCYTSLIDYDFGLDFYIDRISYGLKISQCSDSLAWSKMVSRNNDVDYRLKEGQK
jgi:hypothetical protein